MSMSIKEIRNSFDDYTYDDLQAMNDSLNELDIHLPKIIFDNFYLMRLNNIIVDRMTDIRLYNIKHNITE